MTIWLLTILLLAALAAVGYQQGGIRTGISFFGILLAFLLAALAGKIFVPLLGLLGVKNPIYVWALPPFFGFILVSALVKVGAFFVHQKVDVYYKYKAGDLRLALWERINRRLGACVGLLNGVAYLVLIAFVIHAFSYWTVQLASADTNPKTIRLLNALGRDLQSTGMNRVGKSVDPLKKSFYDTADLAGLLYQNSLLEARLLRYPGFLTLGEKPEFQALGQDSAFAEMRLKATPLNEVLDHSSAKAIFANPDLLKQVWNTVQPDLSDLQAFLETGKSAKYDGEKILGRWRFDANSSMLAYRRTKPNAAGAEVTRMRGWLRERYDKSSIVAAPDKMVALKNFPDNTPVPAGQAPSTQVKNLSGNWQADGLDYAFNLEGGTDKRVAKFEGVHLILSGEPLPVAFRKED
jgi:hypothetical protein